MMGEYSDSAPLPLQGALIVLLSSLFFFSLPEWLSKRYKPSFQEWLRTAHVEGLIQLTIEKPFLRNRVFRELAKRGVQEHRILAYAIGQPSYPLQFRIQSVLALVFIHSPVAEQGLVHALGSDSPYLHRVAIQEVLRLRSEAVVAKIFELIEKVDDPLTLSLAYKTLSFLLLGEQKSSGLLGKDQIQRLRQFWRKWWEKHRGGNFWSWYAQLLESSSPARQRQGILLLRQLAEQRDPSKGGQILLSFGRRTNSPQQLAEVVEHLSEIAPSLAFQLIRERYRPDLPPFVQVQLLGRAIHTEKKGELRPFSEVWPLFQEALKKAPLTVQKHVLHTLAYYDKEPLAAQVLRNYLRHSERDLRYTAAWALAKQGKKEGYSVAEADLDSPKHRIQAIVLLRGIFRKNFGLHQNTKEQELQKIVKKWKKFLKEYRQREKP